MTIRYLPMSFPSPDYDGGDCCECTCVSTTSFTCGEGRRYRCIDPIASCVDGDGSDSTSGEDVDSSTVEPCSADILGDGLCDPVNNIEECGKSQMLAQVPSIIAL